MPRISQGRNHILRHHIIEGGGGDAKCLIFSSEGVGMGWNGGGGGGGGLGSCLRQHVIKERHKQAKKFQSF